MPASRPFQKYNDGANDGGANDGGAIHVRCMPAAVISRGHGRGARPHRRMRVLAVTITVNAYGQEPYAQRRRAHE